jgi:hypothetical protein
MTNKELILEVIRRLPEGASISLAIDELSLMQKTEPRFQVPVKEQEDVMTQGELKRQLLGGFVRT